MGCLCGCKYGRKSSSHHAGALHSSLLASSSLNRPTQSETDDWAEPGGLKGRGGSEGEESSRDRRPVKVPIGQDRRELPGLGAVQPQIMQPLFCGFRMAITEIFFPAHLSKLSR